MEISEMKDGEMIATMIAQHTALRAEVKNMGELVTDILANAEKLHGDMREFRKTLEAHLAIENEIFYPKILIKMEEKHFDTEKTKGFIEEMKMIGVRVFEFLNSYESSETIKGNPEKYLSELTAISNALEMRMSAEEDGVYMYWNI